jgi:hypothetical protein
MTSYSAIRRPPVLDIHMTVQGVMSVASAAYATTQPSVRRESFNPYQNHNGKETFQANKALLLIGYIIHPESDKWSNFAPNYD